MFGRNRFEDNMDDELRFHLEAYADDLVRSGVSPDEARRRARMEFGGRARVQEECRESGGWRWLDELARNVRYALRVLRKSPGFTLAAVLTLALCIGANTAIFSVIDAALLRPLPYPEPDRLAMVVTHVQSPRGSDTEDSQDGETWRMLADHAVRVDYAAQGGGWTGVNLAAQGKAQYVLQSRVTAGYFHVLGVPPAIGREFTKDEDREGGPAATILSHDLWMRLYNGDPSAVGRSILLRGEPHTVVGVMPARFRPVMQSDLWTPLKPSTQGEGGGTNYEIIARLRRGASFEQGDAEVQALGRRLLEHRKPEPGVTARFGLARVQEQMSGEIGKPLYIIWGAVGVVLLIGCLNIAGLMLVRAAGRTREMATRIALGGGRGAVVRQLLTESLVVALAGGVVGSVVGYAGIRALAPLAGDALGVWQELRLDWRVLLMTMAVSVVTSVVFGMVPAVKAARIDIRTGLTEGARGVAGSSSRWPRRLLVAGEIALSMVLLVGAGLLIRTFLHLRQLTPGFDGTNVLTASLSLQDVRYATADRCNWLFTQTLDRIRALPGVESASVGLHVPYERWLNSGFRRVGDTDYTTVSVNYITPGYLPTLRVPVLAGRDFDGRDGRNAARAAIVNRAFAERYFKDQPVVGTAILLGKKPWTIVGLAGDVQQKPSFGHYGPVAPVPAIYLPAEQTEDATFALVHTWFSPKWVVRASGPRQALIEGMRRAVEQTDPLLPFASFKTLGDVRDETLQHQRLNAALLGTLAALALVLTVIGVYALIASTVAQRSREMGIRMALGASLGRIVATIALPGLALALTGVLAGLLLSFWSTRVLKGAVYGITTLDPLTFATVASLLLGVAVAASLVPALKMTRLNPASTLRDE